MSHSRKFATYFLRLSLPHDIFLHQTAVLNQRGQPHRCAVDVDRMIATQPSGCQNPTDTCKQIVLMYPLSTCVGCLWGLSTNRSHLCAFACTFMALLVLYSDNSVHLALELLIC
ncbi:unnamed protein product [Ectocarpus fasciculatus]